MTAGLPRTIAEKVLTGRNRGGMPGIPDSDIPDSERSVR
jgi:hypothetical protein